MFFYYSMLQWRTELLSRQMHIAGTTFWTNRVGEAISKALGVLQLLPTSKQYIVEKTPTSDHGGLCDGLCTDSWQQGLWQSPNLPKLLNHPFKYSSVCHLKKKKKKLFHTELQESSLSPETLYLAFCSQHPAKTDALSNLPSIWKKYQCC